MSDLPKSYYLAHPLASRHEVRKWELGFESRTGVLLLNPFYDVHRPDIKEIDIGAPNPTIVTPTEIVERDLRGLKSQEGLLCIIDHNAAVGVYQEMVYGSFDKKVIHAVVTQEKLLNHPWILYHSSQVFRDLSEFERFVYQKINRACM